MATHAYHWITSSFLLFPFFFRLFSPLYCIRLPANMRHNATDHQAYTMDWNGTNGVENINIHHFTSYTHTFDDKWPEQKKKTNCAESRILVATLEWPCHFVETSWDDPIGRHCDGSELMYLMHTNVLYVLRTHRNWLCNTSSLISISNGEVWCVEEWSTMSGYGRGWWLLSTTKVCQTSRGNKTTTTTKK